MSELIHRDAVLTALSRHVGREGGVTAHALVIEIAGTWSAGAERELRHVVETLRREGVAVVATPRDGYFIARDADELHQTIRFLRRRALCSLTQIRQLKRLAVPLLSSQRRLML